MTIATTDNSEYGPGLNRKYPTIEELKQKYESYTIADAKTALAKPHPSANNMLAKSKVKQIASMFDKKISESAKNSSKNMISNSPKINAPIPAIRHSIQSNFGKDKTAILSSRTKSKLKVQQTSNTFFASEDTFTKLSVKHKVHLYNEFVNQMFKNNLKLVKPDEQMEPAGVEKTAFAGEVINEKQASVKHLLAKLEANCPLPRQNVSPMALPRLCNTSSENDTEKAKLPPVKAKEFEDILENVVNHTSTLTVKLKPSKPGTCKERSKPLPRNKIGNKEEFNVTVENTTSLKRHNGEMRYYLPFEVFAPPKKIRCTRSERPPQKALYQTQQMKNLFLTWLSEREQKENEEAESKSNSNNNQLSENTATTGLEDPDNNTSRGNEKLPTKCKPLEPTPRQRKKKPAPPIPAPVSNANNSQVSAKVSEKFQSNDDSESGISLVQKITSDESQADKPAVKSEKEYEFVKPLKPVRKRKLRRNLIRQNNESSEETISINSDSDTDDEIKTDEITILINEQRFPNHPSSEELDSDLLRKANSPRKIKSAYTLTAYSPSPTQEEEDKIKDSKSQTSQNFDSPNENLSSSSQENKEKINYLRQRATEAWSAALKDTPEQQFSSSNQVSSADVSGSASTTLDSLVDQGFETGSNDMDSPVRSTKSTGSLLLKSTTEPRKPVPTPLCFSAPITSNKSIQFSNSVSQELFCNSSTIPLKSRRQSVHDNEPRRSSLAMQIIRENEPLQQNQILTRSSSIKEQNFAITKPSLDTPRIVIGQRTERGSKYWIKCNNFSLAFDIFYSEAGRLRVLYDIFSQTSCENVDLYFGIDDLIFSISPANKKQNFPKSLQQEYSTYWFATGDAFIPFAGKRVSAEKIKHIFEFLKTSVEDNGVVHFGVDAIEFSTVREICNQTPKFSMDINYSMLVGLQSGTSNDLEGRSKYSWPYTQSARISYLDRPNSGIENFEHTNSGRSSVSPFSGNQFHFTTSSPTDVHPRQQSMTNSEIFNFGYRNESLDRLFEDEYKELPQSVNAPAPEALKKIKTQQECLRLIQERLSNYNNPANFSCAALDALRGTPQYIKHLKKIATKIINKGRRDNFKSCTFQQLQSYMFFLSRYADICLHDCSGHIDKVLGALLDHRHVTL